MLKKVLFSVVFLFSVVIHFAGDGSSLTRQENQTQYKIAVCPFVGTDAMTEEVELGETIRNMLRSELVHHEVFEILEQEQTRRILEAIKGEYIFEADSGVVRIMGERYGVDILAAIDTMKSDSQVKTGIRLVDTQSGEILFSETIGSESGEELRNMVGNLARTIEKKFLDETSLNRDQESHGTLKDGRYSGEIEVWPEMKVEVIIKEGQIWEVRVIEDNGTPEFSKDVLETLPPKIVSQGSVDVDGVSGATLSSNSLKAAVKAALEKAR